MENSQYNTIERTPRIVDVVRSLNTKEWDVHPDFQRPFVWKLPQMRRLIESVLLGYTLPTFFAFDKFEEGRDIVVGETKKGEPKIEKQDVPVTYFSDGQQRLETLRRFLGDKFTFMTELEQFEHLNGKKFSQFSPTDRQRITEACLKIEKWPDGTPEEVIQDHYDRINTGGKPLTYGHIRKNRYKGKHFDFLSTLAQNKDYLTILGSKANADNMLKMEPDVQCWIYAANIQNKTFDHNDIIMSEQDGGETFGNYRGNPINPTKGIVENFLKHYKEHPEECTEEYKKSLSDKFYHATKLLNSLFGAKAFAKPIIEDGVWKTDKNGNRKFGSFNLGIYEILMYLFSYADESTVIGREDIIRAAYYEGIRKNPKLQNALWYATTSDESTRYRYFGFYQTFVDAGVKFNG